MRTEEQALGRGSDGQGPQGERGRGAFPELFRYWRDAGEEGERRARSAAGRNQDLQVDGRFTVRYRVKVWEIVCRQWQECNAQGTGYVSRTSQVMTPRTDEQGELGPRQVQVEHAGAGTVQREVVRVVTTMFRELRAQNEAAEAAAKEFSQRCR